MGRIAIILGVTVMIIGIGYSMVPGGSEDVLKLLDEKGIYAKSYFAENDELELVHALQIGDSTNQPLLLIHGSPGDWSAWSEIILNDSVREKFYIIAVDRPGFGSTTIPAKYDLKDQASALIALINGLDLLSPITIAGHSYGGAVVEQLLLDLPANTFDKAILVAATVDPDLMEPRWYNKVAKWRWINTILPEDMKASNIEMLGLPESLRTIEDRIENIQTPIILIQGKKDILVPFETIDYFEKLKPLGVKYILIDDMNHFIPWSDPYLITDELLNKSKY